jgi:Flp pilus assembly protein TadB
MEAEEEKKGQKERKGRGASVIYRRPVLTQDHQGKKKKARKFLFISLLFPFCAVSILLCFVYMCFLICLVIELLILVAISNWNRLSHSILRV